MLLPLDPVSTAHKNITSTYAYFVSHNKVQRSFQNVPFLIARSTTIIGGLFRARVAIKGVFLIAPRRLETVPAACSRSSSVYTLSCLYDDRSSDRPCLDAVIARAATTDWWLAMRAELLRSSQHCCGGGCCRWRHCTRRRWTNTNASYHTLREIPAVAAIRLSLLHTPRNQERVNCLSATHRIHCRQTFTSQCFADV